MLSWFTRRKENLCGSHIVKVSVAFSEARDHKKVWQLISSRIADFYEIKNTLQSTDVRYKDMSVDVVAKRILTYIDFKVRNNFSAFFIHMNLQRYACQLQSCISLLSFVYNIWQKKITAHHVPCVP